MKTQKGYILPIILVIILLVLAGFIVFTQKQVIAPESEESLFATSTTDTIDSSIATTTNSIEDAPSDDPVSTTTDSVEDVSIQCVQNEECSDGGTCYFEPGGSIGVCTNL
jgi:hypothetical protein